MLYNSDPEKPDSQVSALVADQQIQEQPEVDWSELDWTGWKENSLTTQLGQWAKSKLDPTYVIPGSKQDLDEQEVFLTQQIQQLEDFKSPEARKIVAGYYEDLQDIASKKAIMKAEEDTEVNLEDIWDAVSEDPERFAFNMAQETINKPELLAAGALGGWGWGVLGTRAAIAVSLGTKAQKVAKVSGSVTGAYTGGVALGTVDRAIENANRTGEFKLGKAYEQSQIDGVIAVASYGTFAAARRGTRGLIGLRNSEKFKAEAEDLETSSLDDTIEALGEEEVPQSTLNKEAHHPVDTEIYVDAQGNSFVLELQDVKGPEAASTFDMIAQAEKKIPGSELKKIKTDNRKLNRDIAKWNQQIDDFGTLGQTNEVKAKVEDLQTKIQEASDKVTINNSRLFEHQKAMEAQETLYGYTQDGLMETPEFVKVPTPDGGSTILRKMDPDLTLEQNNIKIDGFSATDFSMEGQPSGYQNAWEAVMTNWFRSATAPLQGIRDTSPSAALLLEKLNPNSKNPKAKMWSLQEDITFDQGYFNNKMRDILVELKERYPGKDYEQKVMLHMRNVEPSEDPQIQKAAIGIRNLLDEHREFMVERGVKVEEIADYLPRRWDKEKLKTDQGKAQFIERLMLTENRTKSEAENSWRDIVEDRNEDNGILTASGSTANKQPFGQRSLKKLKDSEVSDLLSETFFEDITKHVMAGTRRAALAKVFGDGGEQLQGLMKDISSELEAAGRPLRPEEQQRIYDIYNAFNGRYKPIQQEAVNTVNNAVATSVNLSKLGMATITSLTEPLVMMARLNESSGVGGALRTYVHAGKSAIAKAFGGLKEHEFITEAREMGLITDQAISEVLDQMQGVGMDGKLARINHKWFRMTGLHQWTELSRGMAFGSAKMDIQKTAAKLAADPGDGTRRRWLTEAGIDPDQAIEWVNGGADIEAPFYTELKRGAVRMANEIIANPNPVNKPLWMSSPKMKLVSQLKAYPITFGNVILKRQYEEWKASKAEGRGARKAANLAVTGATMATGYYLLGMFKDALRGNDLALDDEEKQLRNVSRAVVNLLGPVGIISPVFEGMGERYGSNSLMSTVAPFAGTAGKIIEDPARGLIDAAPGSTIIPTEAKKELVDTIKN